MGVLVLAEGTFIGGSFLGEWGAGDGNVLVVGGVSAGFASKGEVSSWFSAFAWKLRTCESFR